MGLFDRFKKKEEPQPIQNKMNSVFTMKFIVPFFQIFDKTNPKLAHFPIRMAVGGSVQYRIADPDLCFNNVSLTEMTPEQLEEHVKDGLTAVVKTYLNSITQIPVLQFESAIMKINDAAKAYVIPIFVEEYGINLRTFNISRINYDVEDPNYRQLQQLSREAVNHMSEKQASEHKIDLNRDRITIEKDNREINRLDLEIMRESNAIEIEKRKMEHELRAQEMHLEQDIYERKKATDKAAENGTLSTKKGYDFSLDLDTDDFKLDGL